MSSHMFEEVEHICDKVGLIKDGKLIATKSTGEIKHNENKEYKIEFVSVRVIRNFYQNHLKSWKMSKVLSK